MAEPAQGQQPSRTATPARGPKPPRRPVIGARAKPSRVSKAFARRFARKDMRRRRRRTLVVFGVLLAVAGLAYLVLASPLLRVQGIEVVGTKRISAATVTDQAQAWVGDSMVLADTDALARQVAENKVAREVHVERGWPSTLRIVVDERVPVAAVPAGARFSLVDTDGVIVEDAAKVPKGLAVVEVDLLTGGAPALRAALAVIDTMPPDLLSQVTTIGANSAYSVWFVLRDRSRVEWGSPERAQYKADVLKALRAHKARVYDVSAPDAPAVSGG